MYLEVEPSLNKHVSEAAKSFIDEPTRVSKSLGWFSIALGATAMAAPRGVANLIGVDEAMVVRAVGAREVASGAALLAQPTLAYSAWSRVAGDAMDIALLGAAMRSPTSNKRRVAGGLAFVLGITAIDLLWSLKLTRDSSRSYQGEAS